MSGAQKTDDRCKAEVWKGFHAYRCSRKAVKDGYCKQHHPDTKAERDAKNHAAWEEKKKREPWHIINELKKELEAAREELERLKEGLTILAGLPDKDGHTHGAELHDVAAMHRYAQKLLSPERKKA